MKSVLAAAEWLAARRSRYLELLEQLVTTESHAAHPDGVATVADTVIAELAPLGFQFERTPQSALPVTDHWLEELLSPGVSYTGLGATYSGSRPGVGAGRLLLLGDLDTAFPVGTLTDFPFRVDGNNAYGPGIADMKGGLVVLVAALEALHHFDLATPGIALVLSGDEQAGSLGSRPIIERASEGVDWCLCVECARRGGKLMAARGHIGVGRLIVKGVEAHTGSARSEGINALEAVARLVIAFNRLTDPEAGTLVTVTMAESGRRRSIVPAHAVATVDIRTRAPEPWEAVTTAMRGLAEEEENKSGARIELLMHNHRPGVLWDGGTDRMLELAREVGGELSIPIEAFESAAAGSSAFRPPSTPTLDGLGPLGSNLMTMQENIDLDSLVPRAAMLTEIIHRLPGLLRL